METYFLIYVSYASKPWTRRNLLKLKELAQHRNKAVGITGALLYLQERFIQVLEGDKEEVTKLYDKITQDQNHRNPLVLLDGYIENRRFPEWHMGFKTVSPKEIEDSRELLNLLDNLNSSASQASHPAVMLLNKFFATNI